MKLITQMLAFVSIYLSIYVNIYVYEYLSIYLSVYLSIYIYMYVCTYIGLRIWGFGPPRRARGAARAPDSEFLT